jgi:hypothetical protein
VTAASVRAGGCYVYGLVRDDGTSLPEVTGVAGLPLRLVSAGEGSGVAAVVSDLPAPDHGMGRADLLAHSDALQALISQRDVVPVRFGSGYPSDDDMRGELLAARLGQLRRLLDSVAGTVEMQVKLGYVEAAVTAEIVAADRKLRKLRAAGRSGPRGQAAQIELGRRFASALDNRRAADTRRLAHRLRKLAVATTAQDGAGDFGLARIACLVPRARLDAFDAEVGRLEAEHAGRLTVALLGPLPPYSFVAGRLDGGR